MSHSQHNLLLFMGRPFFDILAEQIRLSREGAWFTWTDVARIQELGMPLGDDVFPLGVDT